MTRTTNARIAGVTFILYIVVGMTSIYLSTLMTGGSEETSAKLSAIISNRSLAQLNIILTLLSAAFALVLAVTIYGLTFDIDRELAILALCCRVAEGVIIVMATLLLIATLSIANSAGTGVGADPAYLALAETIFHVEGYTGLLAGLCFATGSTTYCYLLLRSHRMTAWMAWLGLFSSAILVVLLPLRIAGVVQGPLVTIMWLPMLVFELVFSFWLLTAKERTFLGR
jgi:hypothetical protein